MSPPPEGALQPNGTRSPEAVFDAKHVGETIVHIASLPLDVTVLTFNIMCVRATFSISPYLLPFPGVRFRQDRDSLTPILEPPNVIRATGMPFVGRG